MSATPFDWSRRIAEIADATFGIPPDVILQIVEGDHLYEVKAHKMILAMVSHTFKTMFYSTDVGDKTAKVVKIQKTTAPAFQILMDAIYNTKSIGDSLQGKSVDEVFHVMELIERFHIPELMEAVKELLAKFPITDDSMLEVAEVAMEYSTMFPAESEHLVLICAQFLAPTECPNCKKEVCQDGKAIKDDEFREGLIVTNNKASGAWGKNDYGTVKVTKLEAADKITFTSIKPGVTQNGFLGKQFNNASFALRNAHFLFSCK